MSFFAMFLVVFAVMLLVVLGMAAGVLAGRKPIAGSCGGIAALGIEQTCSICGGDLDKCEEANADGTVQAKQNLAYDATAQKS